MNKFIILTLLSLIVLCIASSDVLEFNDKNFDEEVKKHEFILVEFFAPWCGHCKSLAPEYEKAATTLKGQIPLAKVDCDANRKVAEKNQIQGFPTMKLFKNGKAYKEYDSGRTADEIVAWLKKKTGPPAQALKSQKEVEDFVKENQGTAVVGYFKSKESEEYKTFIKQLESDKALEDFVAGEMIDEKQEPHVTLFRSFDKDLTTKDLKELPKFLKENGYPLIDEISAKNFQRFLDDNVPLGVLFLNYDKKDEKEKTIKLMEKVAEKLKGKFNWAYSNGKEYKDQLSAMGGDSEKIPAIAAMDLEKRQNYPYSGNFNEDEIEQWAEGIISGKVKPFYRSDPVPEKNDGPVYVVVGKTYEKIVLDEKKDVLLEFYAPWCGHCKSLAPKYEQLAKYFQNVDNLVIAKIDATTNDTPYPIEGFPTIVFFPGNNKDKPIPYEGDRSVKDMVDFVKKHASVSKKSVESIKADIPKAEHDEL